MGTDGNVISVHAKTLRPVRAKTEISSLLVTDAAVAEKFCSSPRQTSGHEHSNVCAERFRSAELLFGTRREHPHCSRKTLPFRGSLAHLPVLSRRLFGVCKRHLDCYFFAWYCTSPFRRFWYWYCDARMKGERGIGVGATVLPLLLLLLCVLRPRVTGADPASHRVRLWRGGSASTVPFSFFFPFIVLVVVD